jgi:hypothetical protein
VAEAQFELSEVFGWPDQFTLHLGGDLIEEVELFDY